MPAHRVSDPLVSLSIRIPQSLRDRLDKLAKVDGVTLADQVRARLNFDEVKPLGTPVKRRRAVQHLVHVRSSDPSLLRYLASIGSNLNQVARAVNTGAVAGDLVQSIELLAVLCAIERDFTVLVNSNIRSTDAH